MSNEDNGVTPSSHGLSAIGSADVVKKRASIYSVWMQARENHRRYSATGSQEGDIRFHALGLAGEAGEVANFVKKRWRDQIAHDEDLQKEVADVCAYAFMLADALGMTPDLLMQTISEKQAVFIAKMEERSFKALDEPRGLSASEQPCCEAVIPPHPVAPNTQEEGT